MAHWVNKDQWIKSVDTAVNRQGKQQFGYQGDRVNPTTYRAYYGHFPLATPKMPNGVRSPNMTPTGSHIVALFINQTVPFPSARNQAWGSLVSKIRAHPASVGVALAESEQALGMIGSRLMGLYGGYNDLRHGRFRPFLRRFNMTAKRKHRNKVSNAVNEASSLWLEYSFGWKPLTQDIWDGFHALRQPLPEGRVQGYGKEAYNYHYYNGGTGIDEEGKGRCNMFADVFIDNPNIFALQQLGLANPAQVIWELVPFSFMVDWVFDVGTCLGGLTDLLGCDVRRPCTSFACKAKVTNYTLYQGNPANRYELGGPVSAYKRTTGLSFPLPNTNFRSNIGSSLKRAANAASLLGQILTK